MQVTTQFLKYLFTETELKDKSTSLAQECRNLEEVENDKKQVMSDFKSKIDGHQASISKLSNHINNGYEYRQISCEVKMDTPIQGQKTIIRKDTGEIVKIEEMTQQEMQMELELTEQ